MGAIPLLGDKRATLVKQVFVSKMDKTAQHSADIYLQVHFKESRFIQWGSSQVIESKWIHNSYTVTPQTELTARSTTPSSFQLFPPRVPPCRFQMSCNLFGFPAIITMVTVCNVVFCCTSSRGGVRGLCSGGFCLYH